MLKLLIPGKDFQELLHKVKLKGVPHPDSFFICYPQPDGKVHLQVQSIATTCYNSLHALYVLYI